MSRGQQLDIRGVRLEDICNPSHKQASDKSVIPDILPTLLHILLARLDAEQVTRRGIVVVTVVSGTTTASSREALDVLRTPKETAGAKRM